MIFSERLQSSMDEIQKVGAMFYKTEITDDIVLYGLYRANQHEPIGKLMYNSSMSIFMLRRTLDNEYDLSDSEYGKQENKNLPLSQQSECLFKDAESYALLTGSNEIELTHVVLALLNSENHIIKEYLEDEVDTNRLQKDLIELIYTGSVSRLENKSSKDNNDKKTKELPKVIKNSCEDLTQQAINGEIDPIIGRHKEVDMIINTLSRRTKNNVLIVGPAGSGKTALVKGLTVRILNGEIPALVNKRVFSLNLGALMGGTTYRGQLEEKCADLVKVLMEMEDIILFIDEMHTIMSAGSSGNSDKVSVAGLLKPALTSRKLQIIGCTTEKEVRVIQDDPAFIRRFNLINLDEPDDLETLDILRGLVYKYEEFHEVVIPEETLKAAVRLSSRYIAERYQPDKSIDVIDEAAAKLKLKNRDHITAEKQLELDINNLLTKISYTEEFNELVDLYNELKVKREEHDKIQADNNNEELRRQKRPVLTPDDIALVVEDRTKIPVAKLMTSDKHKLLKLEEDLHKKIIGQELAVKAVSDAVRKNSSGIGNPDKPIAAFMFAGPTGVGKTELCKALADIQFGSAENIIRIDCSEFAESMAVTKLIGSAPGYVGYGEGGQLTEAVRHKPYSVVLFDEFEKAKGNLTNIMLQILDEGRLTDSNGVTVSFKNCIIVLTTNLGSGLIQESRPVGFGNSNEEDQDKAEYEILKDKTMNAIHNNLPPEFINRLSDVIVFTPLNKVEQRQITRLLGKSLDKRLEDLDIVVKCSDEALDFITDEGYDKTMGARPLARAISTYLEQPLSIYLLEDKIVKGDLVKVELEDGKLVFYKFEEDELIPVDKELAK
jgi:ATP-dependent Clp protease ATP-binding subunit ClpC